MVSELSISLTTPLIMILAIGLGFCFKSGGAEPENSTEASYICERWRHLIGMGSPISLLFSVECDDVHKSLTRSLPLQDSLSASLFSIAPGGGDSFGLVSSGNLSEKETQKDTELHSMDTSNAFTIQLELL